jgi:hypothetical protein
VEIKEDVGETRAYAANQIEKKVRYVAEMVFHIVAENPEEEHVSGDVHEAAVQEHTCEDREQGSFKIAMAAQDASDVRGDGSVGHHEGLVLVWGQGELVEKDDHVRQNEKSVDDGVGPPGIQVFERDEH